MTRVHITSHHTSSQPRVHVTSHTTPHLNPECTLHLTPHLISTQSAHYISHHTSSQPRVHITSHTTPHHSTQSALYISHHTSLYTTPPLSMIASFPGNGRNKVTTIWTSTDCYPSTHPHSLYERLDETLQEFKATLSSIVQTNIFPTTRHNEEAPVN